MNERTHSWDPPLDIAEKLLNLDKEDRRKLFTELKGLEGHLLCIQFMIEIKITNEILVEIIYCSTIFEDTHSYNP